MTLRTILVLLTVLAAATPAGCTRNPQPTQTANPPRRFASESTAALLDRWQPTERDSAEIGYELQYRMAGGHMNEADSQRYIDNQIKFDLYGAHWQMTRTAATWPLDGHAFVRAVALYPINPSELRWRRAGATEWRSVAHYGHFVFLDLGSPSEGQQTVKLEYQIKSHQKTVWQGALEVTYEGRGLIADSCELVRDPATDEWLKKSTYRMLRGGRFVLRPPPAEMSPSGLHIAGRVELFRDGELAGQAYAIFGRGHPRTFCGSRPPSDSVEWLTVGGPVDVHKSKWTLRLTSIPELAATAEFDDSQVEDPPPRRVWVGSVEMPMEADARKAFR